MAKLTDDQIRWILSLDASGVQGELKSLSSVSNDLTEQNKRLKKEMQDAAKQMNEAAKEMKKLSESGREGSKEFETASKIFKETHMEVQQYSKRISENTKAIEENNAKAALAVKQLKITDSTYAQLKTRAEELQKQLEHTSKSLDPESYKKIQGELTQVSSRMKDLKSDTAGTHESFFSLKNLIAGLSFVAIFEGLKIGSEWIKSGFEKMIESTKTTADQWEFAMSGMRSGLDYFWKTMASGDWENFFSNFERAIQVGYRYAKMMDEVKESTWALTIAEANTKERALQLEEDLRNKTLSREERIKAGEERIQLEKDMAEKRSKVAETEYEANLLVATERSKLSKETLMTVLSDLGSEGKEKAKLYNEDLVQLKNYQKEYRMQMGTNSTVAAEYTAKKIEQLKTDMSVVPEGVKLYAQSLRKEGNLTDEMINKLIGSYSKLKDAENSAKSNVKRVTTQTNMLIAGEDKETEVENNKTLRKLKESVNIDLENLETKYRERVAAIKEQYAKGDIKSESEYNQKIFANESAYHLLREHAIEEFLKTITNKELRADLEKKLADSHNKQLDNEIKFRENLQKIILDANPEEKERVEYENRLRDVGLFGKNREDLTADQLAALELLEKEHNDNLFKIRQTAEKNAKDQKEDAFEKEFKDRRDELNADSGDDRIGAVSLGVSSSGDAQFKAEEKLRMQRLRALREEIDAREKAGLDASKLRARERVEEQALTKTYVNEYKRRVGLYNQYGQEFGAALGNVLTGQQDALSAFSGIILDILFDTLTNIIQMRLAEATAEHIAALAKVAAMSQAMPDSVATFGATGIARTAIIAGILTGVLAAAKIALKAIIQKPKSDKPEKQPTSGYDDGGFNDAGGFTGPGEKYEVAGILPNGKPFHRGEYFVAQNEMANPMVVDYVRKIESIRRQRTSTNPLPGFADGGYSASRLPSPASGLPSIDPDLKSAIIELNRQIKKGIVTYVNKYGTNGLDESLREINKFNSKVGKK